MSGLHDLIRACKTEPDDDAPRLILADWLEEHGEAERAAFIRRQIVRPNQPCGPEPVPNWFGEWKRWGDEWHAWQTFDAAFPIRFRRGFLQLGDDYRELYDRLDEILSPPFDWTWVEEIKFGSWHDGDWTPLLKSPRLRELNSLKFIDDHYHSVLVAPLADCQFVDNLRELELFMVVMGDDGANRLSQSAHLSGVRLLNLMFTRIGPAGTRALASSEVWDNLRSCSLRANPLGDDGLHEIAIGRRRPMLNALDLAHCANSDRGLVELARSDRFPGLRTLWMGYNQSYDGRPVFGRKGIEAILSSPHFRAVQVKLHLVANEVPPDVESLRVDHAESLHIDLTEPARRL